MIREAEQVERQQRLEQQKTTGGIAWEDIATHLDKDLSEASQKISDLEAENANLKANQQILFSTHTPGGLEEEESAEDEGEEKAEAPATMEEACIRAREMPHLIILDSAVEAARESPFKRPADVLEALSDLEDIAANGVGGDILKQLKDRGWGKRSSIHISATTKSKDGASYQFEYDNKRQYFEPHITIGSGDAHSCASIHYLIDKTCGKFVIGHVGRHLPNTKT
ncbi:MAG: hypothetical protein WBE14_20235 [Xanthobacteraceae bacterium]